MKQLSYRNLIHPILSAAILSFLFTPPTYGEGASPSTTPILLGVYNAASYLPYPAAGAAVVIRGQKFAGAICNAEKNAPLPETLCDLSVEVRVIDGRVLRAALVQVTPDQIQAILPRQDRFTPFPSGWIDADQAAKIVIVNSMGQESPMDGRPGDDAIDIFFLNPDFHHISSAPGLYTSDSSGSGVGLFQRWPSFQSVENLPGKAVQPGDIIIAYGTGYRDGKYEYGSPTKFQVYSLVLTTPNGKVGILQPGSIEIPPGRMLFAGDGPYPGLDQYNIQIPSLESGWFKRTFGEDFEGIVNFRFTLIQGFARVVPNISTNTVLLPVEFHSPVKGGNQKSSLRVQTKKLNHLAKNKKKLKSRNVSPTAQRKTRVL